MADFVKRSIALSAHKAEALSMSSQLGIVNYDLMDIDVSPFKLIWPQKSVLGEKSRYHLPALTFKGELVAELGFRNKDGFFYVRDDVGEQVERAVASRFTMVANRVGPHVKRGAEALLKLEDRLQDLFKDFSPEVIRKSRQVGSNLSSYSLPLLLNSVIHKLQQVQNISYYHRGDMKSGSFGFVIKSEDSDYSIDVGGISWRMNYYNFTISTFTNSKVSHNNLSHFFERCALESMDKKPAKFNPAKLNSEVIATDFGYD